MAKILVTGGTGFIGRKVVACLDPHHQITVMVRDDQQRVLFQQQPSVSTVVYQMGEVGRHANLFTLLNKPDCLIHLAWEHVQDVHHEAHLGRHYNAQKQFLTQLIQEGLEDVTVIGSCSEYGNIEGECKEEMEPQPTTNYGKAKNSLRQELEKLKMTHPFHLKWVRSFFVYGQNQAPSTLIGELECALKKGVDHFDMTAGHQKRDYLPVKLMAEFIVEIALQNRVQGIINCCSGSLVTVRQMVQTFVAASGGQIQLNFGALDYRDYEPMVFWGSITKLQKIIPDLVKRVQAWQK